MLYISFIFRYSINFTRLPLGFRDPTLVDFVDLKDDFSNQVKRSTSIFSRLKFAISVTELPCRQCSSVGFRHEGETMIGPLNMASQLH